jgi:PAS domain-containing protein
MVPSARDLGIAWDVFMQRTSRAVSLRYGAAFAAVILAVFARLAVDAALGNHFPFATLFFAVLFVAGYGGLGPALAATAFGAIISARFLMPSRSGFAAWGREDQVGLVLFLAVSVGISLLGGRLRNARRRAERDAGEAHRRREQLQATLLSIGDAVLVTDAQGLVTSLNPVAESLTGWSQAEAAGQPIASDFQIVNEHTRKEVENPRIPRSEGGGDRRPGHSHHYPV